MKEPGRRRRRGRWIGWGLAAAGLGGLGVAVYYGVGASWACRLPTTGPLREGLAARRLVSGGRARCYLVHVPPRYSPGEPIPVVFALHGFASSPDVLRYMSRWDAVADRETALVVYGLGTSFPLRWNALPDPGRKGPDDVQYLRDVLSDLQRWATIDPARIYVSGYSNGGAMAVRAACALADRVAAVATVAAPCPELGDGCRPARPVPLIAFHGTADRVVAYGGGKLRLAPVLSRLFGTAPQDYVYPAAPEWVRRWAALNRCREQPIALPEQGDVSGVRYGGCAEGAAVVLLSIEGGGHTWPGGRPMVMLGKTTTAIDGSAAMWEFFSAHPLPARP